MYEYVYITMSTHAKHYSNHCPLSVIDWPCLSLSLFLSVFYIFPGPSLLLCLSFIMSHQKRFIERKYRQELKEIKRERERQKKVGDEAEESRK